MFPPRIPYEIFKAAATRDAQEAKTMTMRRITRNRRLTAEEAAKYRKIREQVAEELPDLVARHHERMAVLDELDKLLKQLKLRASRRASVLPT